MLHLHGGENPQDRAIGAAAHTSFQAQFRLAVGNACPVPGPSSKCLPLPPPLCGIMDMCDKDPHRSHVVRVCLLGRK